MNIYKKILMSITLVMSFFHSTIECFQMSDALKPAFSKLAMMSSYYDDVTSYVAANKMQTGLFVATAGLGLVGLVYGYYNYKDKFKSPSFPAQPFSKRSIYANYFQKKVSSPGLVLPASSVGHGPKTPPDKTRKDDLYDFGVMPKQILLNGFHPEARYLLNLFPDLEINFDLMHALKKDESFVKKLSDLSRLHYKCTDNMAQLKFFVDLEILQQKNGLRQLIEATRQSFTKIKTYSSDDYSSSDESSSSDDEIDDSSSSSNSSESEQTVSPAHKKLSPIVEVMNDKFAAEPVFSICTKTPYSALRAQRAQRAQELKAEESKINIKNDTSSDSSSSSQSSSSDYDTSDDNSSSSDESSSSSSDNDSDEKKPDIYCLPMPYAHIPIVGPLIDVFCDEKKSVSEDQDDNAAIVRDRRKQELRSRPLPTPLPKEIIEMPFARSDIDYASSKGTSQSSLRAMPFAGSDIDLGFVYNPPIKQTSKLDSKPEVIAGIKDLKGKEKKEETVQEDQEKNPLIVPPPVLMLAYNVTPSSASKANPLQELQERLARRTQQDTKAIEELEKQLVSKPKAEKTAQVLLKKFDSFTANMNTGDSQTNGGSTNDSQMNDEFRDSIAFGLRKSDLFGSMARERNDNQNAPTAQTLAKDTEKTNLTGSGALDGLPGQTGSSDAMNSFFSDMPSGEQLRELRDQVLNHKPMEHEQQSAQADTLGEAPKKKNAEERFKNRAKAMTYSVDDEGEDEDLDISGFVDLG